MRPPDSSTGDVALHAAGALPGTPIDIPVPQIVDSRRRRQEQCSGASAAPVLNAPMPQMVGTHVDVLTFVAYYLQLSCEQIVDVPAPHVLVELVRMLRVVCLAALQQRRAEQTVDTPVPQWVEELVHVRATIQHMIQMCVCRRLWTIGWNCQNSCLSQSFSSHCLSISLTF